MLPYVVDLISEHPESAGQWTLSRLDGSTLDESMTLHENGIRDGDVLRLGTGTRPSDPYAQDLCHYVASAAADDGAGLGWRRRLGVTASLWSTGVGAAALVSPGPSATSPRAVIAAVVAIVALICAVVANSLDPEPAPTLTFGASAVAFASVAGYLLVPGGPSPPNVFLAAVICAAVSAVLLNATAHGASLYIAIASIATMWAAVAAAITFWPLPTATVGALLAALSLAVLGAAAKMTIVATGLSPRTSSTDDEPPAVGADRARRAHRTVTGLQAGFSLAAASGAVLVAAGHHGVDSVRGAAFTSAVSAVLMFRAARQIGPVRSATSLLAGLISATATFALVTEAAPRHGSWLALITVLLGAAALPATRTDIASRLSPFGRRGLEVADSMALAATVPLACWVGDLFGLVRGLGLS